MTDSIHLINIIGDPIKSRHVGYYTVDRGTEIELHEVIENHYDHPDAPGRAVVPVIQTIMLSQLKRTAHDASSINLLAWIETTIKREQHAKEEVGN